MSDDRMPTTMTFDDGVQLWPLLVAVGDAETGLRLEPNEMYCKESVPTYEWIPGDYRARGYFRALPRTGGEMGPIVEAVENA